MGAFLSEAPAGLIAVENVVMITVSSANTLQPANPLDVRVPAYYPAASLEGHLALLIAILKHAEGAPGSIFSPGLGLAYEKLRRHMSASPQKRRTFENEPFEAVI
jgi:hypothetical protein